MLLSCLENNLETLRAYRLESGVGSGAENMALDEALLEAVRVEETPVLLVRTYAWIEPTLSLGVNQSMRDVDILLRRYAGRMGPSPVVVRRPTGGRAILHGEDVSYAFVTNASGLLKQDVRTSYCLLTKLVRGALERLGIPSRFGEPANERDYVRSPACFETRTSADLLTDDGRKLTGSAQLRRSGGLLQHGSVFLASAAVSARDFSQALFEEVVEVTSQPLEPFDRIISDSILASKKIKIPFPLKGGGD
jgi:lipoate-protein ligase A